MFIAIFSAVMALVFASPLTAQSSRAEVIAQQQADKAASARPYEPTKAERIFLAVKRELIDTPSGFYPLFGSVYGGGGLALGAGYRQYYGARTFWDAKGLLSIRNYKFAELSTTSEGHAQDRITLKSHLGFRDATQVAYYGLGMATDPASRSSFRFTQVYAGSEIKVRPVKWIVLGATLDLENFDTKPGAGALHPSIEERYNVFTAPGLYSDPLYVHSSAVAGIDWRPFEGYARTGGLYQLRYHNYADRYRIYDFDQLEAEVVQHIPLLRENWVVSLHGLMNTTLNDADTVPYFLLPSLGSASTLRGFSAHRFRDRHSILAQAEFRWIPNRYGLDMAIFYDAGKVTSDRKALDLRGLKSDVGIEARFHGPSSTPLRIGWAIGNEGWKIVFGGSAAF